MTRIEWHIKYNQTRQDSITDIINVQDTHSLAYYFTSHSLQGTHAYMVSQAGARKLLALCTKAVFHVDLDVRYAMYSVGQYRTVTLCVHTFTFIASLVTYAVLTMISSLFFPTSLLLFTIAAFLLPTSYPHPPLPSPLLSTLFLLSSTLLPIITDPFTSPPSSHFTVTLSSSLFTLFSSLLSLHLTLKPSLRRGDIAVWWSECSIPCSLIRHSNPLHWRT